MRQQRKNQGKSQQLLLQWSEKNWCYHLLCYKSELRLCFSHWTPESEKRSGLPTILRLQVWSPPPLLVDINRNKAHIGPTHSVHVCVCLCFRERERERETSDEGEGDPATTFGTRARNLGFSTFHIAGQLVLIPSEMEVFCFLLYANQVVWFVRFLWYLHSLSEKILWLVHSWTSSSWATPKNNFIFFGKQKKKKIMA